MSFQDSSCVITSVVGTNGQPLPLQGNTLGPTTKTVKKERHDEAEIQEMAAKMMEQQKAALLKQQQQTQAAQMAAAARQPGLMNAGVNGQQYINNYFPRGAVNPAAPVNNAPPRNGQTNGSSAASAQSSTSPSPEKPKPNDDEESQKGHFGWTTFGGKVHIPYILRQQEKYCAVRMTEMKLLVKYLGCLHPEIYSSCTCVRSYYITEAESRLLNEINHKHCDAQFGREMFTLKDLVVRLSDATKFYQFLDICYRKLISGSKTPSEKCGFIRINKESVVPYTVRNGEQVVPLFYFEGETENLRQKADNLSGWDLAYLKFCCKVQGIRNELFSSESVAVISLTDIKSYFPNGTEFEDYWPSKVVDSNLLLSPQRHNSNNAINWTRQPTAPPPTKIMHQPQATKQQQQPNQQQQSNGNANRYNQQMQQNQVRNLHNAVTLEQLGQQFALGFMQPHQLLAAQQAQAQQNQRGYNSSRNMQQMINAAAGRTYGQYNNGPLPMQQLPNQQTPPPLVRQNNQSQNAAMLNSHAFQQQLVQAAAQRLQMQSGVSVHSVGGGSGSGGGSSSSGRMTNGSQSSGQNSATMHLQRHAANLQQTNNGYADQRLNVIPDVQNTMHTPPYKVQKVYVDNTTVPCINMKAYQDTDQLIALTDLREFLFPKASLEICRRSIEALRVEMYKGNRKQVQILMENNRISNDNIPLVQVRDILKFMPQLRFMIQNNMVDAQHQQQPLQKRARIS
ncbi:hypothetical protein ACFFRR_003245 [Megaselia abdita]